MGERQENRVILEKRVAVLSALVERVLRPFPLFAGRAYPRAALGGRWRCLHEYHDRVVRNVTGSFSITL